MAKAQRRPQHSPSSVELLGARLQKIINSPASQRNHAALAYKAPDEAQDDWNQIMEAINDTDGVYVTPLDDGGVKIYWDVPEKD